MEKKKYRSQLVTFVPRYNNTRKDLYRFIATFDQDAPQGDVIDLCRDVKGEASFIGSTRDQTGYWIVRFEMLEPIVAKEDEA